jgi:hypothetical protein
MNISNNSCVDKMDECVVYKSAVDRAGMEDGEVSIFNAGGVEVRMREGARVQSHAVDRVSLLATSLDSHAIPD